MTTAHVKKFAELVAKDPTLQAKLGMDKVNADAVAASASAAAFTPNAVKEAKALGLEFTDEELNAFLAAERTAAESGELSETQLEGVAGGVGGPRPGIITGAGAWSAGGHKGGIKADEGDPFNLGHFTRLILGANYRG